MKAVVAAFNQEKALVGAFSVITNLRMELFEALMLTFGRPSVQCIRQTRDNDTPEQILALLQNWIKHANISLNTDRMGNDGNC